MISIIIPDLMIVQDVEQHYVLYDYCDHVHDYHRSIENRMEDFALDLLQLVVIC
jgi:hypothetical protein